MSMDPEAVLDQNQHSWAIRQREIRVSSRMIHQPRLYSDTPIAGSHVDQIMREIYHEQSLKKEFARTHPEKVVGHPQ